MSSHRFPPAFDIALPNGGTIHVVDVSDEFPPGTTAQRVEYHPPAPRRFANWLVTPAAQPRTWGPQWTGKPLHFLRTKTIEANRK